MTKFKIIHKTSAEYLICVCNRKYKANISEHVKKSPSYSSDDEISVPTSVKISIMYDKICIPCEDIIVDSKQLFFYFFIVYVS